MYVKFGGYFRYKSQTETTGFNTKITVRMYI